MVQRYLEKPKNFWEIHVHISVVEYSFWLNLSRIRYFKLSLISEAMCYRRSFGLYVDLQTSFNNRQMFYR